MNKLFKVILFTSVFFGLDLCAKTIFYHYNVFSSKDKRLHYENDILKLALDKTVKKYGEYELLPARKMTKKRAIETLRNNRVKNFILKISVTKELLDEFAYANFPIDRGVTGYRVCFISPKIKKDTKKYDTLEKIKKLNIAQGIGWLDSDILKYNGFKVTVLDGYESFFNIVALGRVDLFPRGIDEIVTEYSTYKYIKNLDYDKTFVLRYDFPRFFFTNKANKKAIKRIEEGLILSYKDGSLKKIFDKYFKKNIKSLNLKDRAIYTLENPFIKGIDPGYKRYNINPFQ